MTRAGFLATKVIQYYIILIIISNQAATKSKILSSAVIEPHIQPHVNKRMFVIFNQPSYNLVALPAHVFRPHRVYTAFPDPDPAVPGGPGGLGGPAGPGSPAGPCLPPSQHPPVHTQKFLIDFGVQSTLTK